MGVQAYVEIHALRKAGYEVKIEFDNLCYTDLDGNTIDQSSPYAVIYKDSMRVFAAPYVFDVTSIGWDSNEWGSNSWFTKVLQAQGLPVTLG